ncbi:hypothetical protein GIW54_07305 [Pseudomonas proteolytica]|uniref:3-isopropylmalate dehydratase n=1 Tax=Pseudomonas proteolytica TaxID=219574 RepID=A0AAW5A8F5_9PSED|nr:hypothetical protein [Pseudomonas proteolytica]MCF5056966.1 hypothetical protein [Pseudomonas proteolytica]MCF5100570.1 hypothetical protein [Pseudomonas proteolytica]
MLKIAATTALFAALLAGCATSPVPIKNAVAVPPERVLAYQKDVPGTGTLSVTRDSGHTGSLCSVGLFVDGKVAALLNPGERVSLHVPAGSVVVGAAYQGSGICGMGADRQEREAIVTDGKVKNYRISTSGDGVLDILPTTL